jgi:hypothetical protein
VQSAHNYWTAPGSGSVQPFDDACAYDAVTTQHRSVAGASYMPKPQTPL